MSGHDERSCINCTDSPVPRTSDDRPVAVGARCIVERRGSAGSLDHRYEAVVVRLTPRRAYLSSVSWFALSDPKREVKPRYLDYRTTVTEIL